MIYYQQWSQRKTIMNITGKIINHISDLAFPLFILIMQMVQDLVRLMFEEEGEPGQLKNEIGHVFLIDRGTKGSFIFFL